MADNTSSKGKTSAKNKRLVDTVPNIHIPNHSRGQKSRKKNKNKRKNDEKPEKSNANILVDEQQNINTPEGNYVPKLSFLNVTIAVNTSQVKTSLQDENAKSEALDKLLSLLEADPTAPHLIKKLYYADAEVNTENQETDSTFATELSLLPSDITMADPVDKTTIGSSLTSTVTSKNNNQIATLTDNNSQPIADIADQTTNVSNVKTDVVTDSVTKNVITTEGDYTLSQSQLDSKNAIVTLNPSSLEVPIIVQNVKTKITVKCENCNHDTETVILCAISPDNKLIIHENRSMEVDANDHSDFSTNEISMNSNRENIDLEGASDNLTVTRNQKSISQISDTNQESTEETVNLGTGTINKENIPLSTSSTITYINNSNKKKRRHKKKKSASNSNATPNTNTMQKTITLISPANPTTASKNMVQNIQKDKENLSISSNDIENTNEAMSPTIGKVLTENENNNKNQLFETLKLASTSNSSCDVKKAINENIIGLINEKKGKKKDNETVDFSNIIKNITENTQPQNIAIPHVHLLADINKTKPQIDSDKSTNNTDNKTATIEAIQKGKENLSINCNSNYNTNEAMSPKIVSPMTDNENNNKNKLSETLKLASTSNSSCDVKKAINENIIGLINEKKGKKKDNETVDFSNIIKNITENTQPQNIAIPHVHLLADINKTKPQIDSDKSTNNTDNKTATIEAIQKGKENLSINCNSNYNTNEAMSPKIVSPMTDNENNNKNKLSETLKLASTFNSSHISDVTTAINENIIGLTNEKNGNKNENETVNCSNISTTNNSTEKTQPHNVTNPQDHLLADNYKIKPQIDSNKLTNDKDNKTTTEAKDTMPTIKVNLKRPLLLPNKNEPEIKYPAKRTSQCTTLICSDTETDTDANFLKQENLTNITSCIKKPKQNCTKRKKKFGKKRGKSGQTNSKGKHISLQSTVPNPKQDIKLNVPTISSTDTSSTTSNSDNEIDDKTDPPCTYIQNNSVDTIAGTSGLENNMNIESVSSYIIEPITGTLDFYSNNKSENTMSIPYTSGTQQNITETIAVPSEMQYKIENVNQNIETKDKDNPINFVVSTAIVPKPNQNSLFEPIASTSGLQNKMNYFKPIISTSSVESTNENSKPIARSSNLIIKNNIEKEQDAITLEKGIIDPAHTNLGQIVGLLNVAVEESNKIAEATLSNSDNCNSYRPDNKCLYCDEKFHLRSSCPALTAVCQICTRIGHFAIACKTRQFPNSFNEPDALMLLSSNMKPVTINNRISSAILSNEIAISLIDLKTTKSLNLKVHLFNREDPRHAMVNSVLDIQGICIANVKCKENMKTISFYVHDGLCSDIVLGRDDKMKLMNPLTAIQPVSVFTFMTPNVQPIQIPSKHCTVEDNKFISKEITKLLKDGIIEPSTSPWRSQVVIINNDGHKKRLIVNFSQTVNKYTELDCYNIPDLDMALTFLSLYRHYTRITLNNAYHQIPILEQQRVYTAFEANGCHYQFTRLPYGLVNGAIAFHRAMENLITYEHLAGTQVYYDNILICGLSKEQHDKNVKEFIKSCSKFGIMVNNTNCEDFGSRIKFLGYVVQYKSIEPDRERVSPLIDYPIPYDSNSLDRTLMMLKYYSKYIKNFKARLAPIIAHGKKFPLPDALIRRFQEIIQDVSESSKIRINNLSLMTVETDFTYRGIEATLSQQYRAIAFFSRSFIGNECRMLLSEKEALTIVEALKKWREYLLGKHFLIMTDLNESAAMLKQGTSQTFENKSIEKWRVELEYMKYDIVAIPTKYYR